MSRPTQTETESWRSAYDVTEKQARALVALIAAQLLDYDGATVKAMLSIGLTKHEANSVSALQHLGLVEVVGYTDGINQKVFRATTRAFRRFNVPLPRPIPSVIQTTAVRAEMIAERAKRRRHEQGWRVAGGEVG